MRAEVPPDVARGGASRQAAGTASPWPPTRWLVAGVAVPLLLFAGGVLFILKLEHRPRSTPAAAPAGPGTLASPLLAAPRPLAAAPVPPRDAGAPQGVRAPAPSPVAPSAPQSDPAALRAALGPLQQEVEAGLAALDERILRCGLARPDLVLDLVALNGRVHVAGVRPRARDPGEIPEGVAPPPPEDEAAVACVRRTLTDELLAAPSSRVGRRWELVYSPSRPR